MANSTYVLQCNLCGEDLASVDAAKYEQITDETERVKKIQSDQKVVQCHNCGTREFRLK